MNSPALPTPNTPRDDQLEAVRSIITAWENHHSAQMIAACGTGKTTTMATVIQQTNARHAVMFVPTLPLVAQHARTIAVQLQGQVIFAAVCSDDTLGKKRRTRLDEPVMSEQDLGLEVLHNADEINAWYVKHAAATLPLVLLSTYASAQHVVDAQWSDNTTTPEFDVAFMDEAHHLVGNGTGDVEGETIKVKDDGRHRLRAKKRLYATATPKTASAKAKNQLRAGTGKHGDYMDDGSPVYGPWAYHLSFGAAIEAGILVDYEVNIVAVSNAELRDQVIEYPGLAAEDDITGLTLEAQEVVAREVIRKLHTGGVNKFLTYQNTVARAKRFADIINASGSLGLPAANHVNGKQKAAVRSGIIDALSQRPDGMVLTNVQVMNEGVDSPALDAVVFIDPKYSEIDIIQCIGRVLRRNDGKELGRVIIVVIVPDDIADLTITEEHREQLLADSQAFKPVFAVLNALEQHDVVIQEMMESYRITGQRPRKLPVRNRRSAQIAVTGMNGLDTRLTRTLANSVNLVAARKPRQPSNKYADWEAWQKREDWILATMNEAGVSYDDAARFHDLGQPTMRAELLATLVRAGRTVGAAEEALDEEMEMLAAALEAGKLARAS
jgi:predicted helicase